MAAPKGHTLPHAKAWRQRLWLTQDELARRSGVNLFTLRRAEQGGSISAPVVRKLADALGITPEQLCFGEPEKAAI